MGEGERASLVILKSIFGKSAEYKIQYPFFKLMSEEFYDTLSDTQKKQTLDIVIFRPLAKTIVIRVQDKHHTGVRTSGVDLIQKTMLEWNDCIVIDLWFYDCPNIWKEEVNDASRTELLTIFKATKGIL